MEPARRMSADPGAGLVTAPAEARIRRMRKRCQTGGNYISIERARYFTESWKTTYGMAPALRVARAMKNVYEKMTHYLDPDDHIAGYWCEHFLGIPVDIERGVFNSVLEAELDKRSLVAFRARTMARGMAYMVKKGKLGEFVKTQKMSREAGAAPLNMSLKTMSERAINPYLISEDDKKELLRELLPYWKGKTTVDKIEAELLRSGLLSKEMRDFVLAIPGNTSRQVFMLSTCTTIASYHAHMILDYGPVLAKGLLAMKDEVTRAAREAGEAGQEVRDFLRATELALEGVIIFAARLADRIEAGLAEEQDPERRQRLAQMLDTCRKVPLHPAETFEQAVQSMWTVKTAIELAHPVYLNCFGRLDQQLYPYYERDLREGRITPERAVELLSELLLKIMSQNIRPESNILANFYHRFLGSSPVTLAGLTPDGKDGTNELTGLFLDAAHVSKAITNVSVRIHRDTPPELLEKVARYLAAGTSSFSLFCDEMNIKAMEKRGFAQRDARDYAVMGCVETTCPGRTGPMSANAMQMSQLLGITLRNGDSRIMAGTIKNDGIRTGDPDSFKNFEELVEALIKQAEYFMDNIVKGSNLRDRMFAEHLPAPIISAFVDGCLENKKDVTNGGARYVFAGVSMINSLANMIDSLLVIKKLVFEQKKHRIGEIVAAMDVNFKGHERMLRDIRAVGGKWGNGDPETDRMAAEITGRLFDLSYRRRTWAGGPVVIYIISMITHTIDGRLSIASPDGRKAAMPYAASCNPYNVEKSGVTAALRSVASLPFEHVMGCAVNMKFHPTAVGKNPAARKKWAALVKTYFQLGGAQMQPTVAGVEMLRKAQTDPDAYRDLIVKVGGYSTYFVELGREIQEEIIARTEHGC